MPDARRILDILVAGLGLMLVWPLFLIIALLIKMDDGGPVFFRQERIGRGGVPFQLLKFRSMHTQKRGPFLTAAGDPRITRIGRFLRRIKLDELPQLLQVLKGDMRLVGPRPEVARYVAHYTPQQRRVLDLTPGITDPASLRFIDEERLLAGEADLERAYVQQLMPEKIHLNLTYASHATAMSDLMLILRTVAIVLKSLLDTRVTTCH